MAASKGLRVGTWAGTISLWTNVVIRVWIRDSFCLIVWFAMLWFARLAVLLLCVAEVMGVLALWAMALAQWIARGRPMFALIPIAATLVVVFQVVLWQFTWLRVAQRGGYWRALAEFFSAVVRYPVVRTPHPWE